MLKPELDGVGVRGCRRLIHQRLQGEVLLPLAGCAHDQTAQSSERGLIAHIGHGVDLLQPVLNFVVRPFRRQKSTRLGGAGGHPCKHGAQGTRVHHVRRMKRAVHRNQAAICIESALDIREPRRRSTGPGQILLQGPLHPHRFAR